MSTTDYANGGIPKTIDELKDYCERNGFTPSKTRFFVGFDYTGAKAFGIYKDDELPSPTPRRKGFLLCHETA